MPISTKKSKLKLGKKFPGGRKVRRGLQISFGKRVSKAGKKKR